MEYLLFDQMEVEEVTRSWGLKATTDGIINK